MFQKLLEIGGKMIELKKISMEELTQLIIEKYGEGWNLKNADSDDELIQEFMDRIAQGS